MGALNRYLTTVSVSVLLLTLSANSAETVNRPPAPLATPDMITHVDAVRMAQAALDDCAKRGQPTTVVVVDAAGFQRVAYSDDNAKLIGVVHSGRKAAAVLAFKVSTQTLQTRAETDKEFAAQYGKDERYLLQAGGLPIYKSGVLVAAIAVGGSGEVNEACAQAGVKAVSWATTGLSTRP
jgi:uncharacterized protein GlcG (DUF336 family)